MNQKLFKPTMRDYLIIIPTHLDLNWSADYYDQTAATLSSDNIVYLFAWNKAKSLKEIIFEKQKHFIIEKRGKINLYNPIHLIPFRRFQYISQVNMMINFLILMIYLKIKLKNKKFKKKILWVFFPYFVKLIPLLSKQWISIYDCVDYQEKSNYKKQEKKLINRVTHMFVISHTLYDLHKKERKNIHIVPQGFCVHIFKNQKIFNIRFTKKNFIIGYIGGINERLDYELLFQVINKKPDCLFVFWGPIQFSEKHQHMFTLLQKLLSFPNVIHGESKKNEIPHIVKQFNIGIIPYTNSEFNRYCFPMKLMEYFYLGKPVIATDIQELHAFKDFVFISRNTEEFIQNIQYIQKNGWSKNLQKKQRRIATKHSWKAKIQKILHILNNTSLAFL